MGDQVTVSARSDLDKIIGDLKKVTQAAEKTQKALAESGKVVSKGVDDTFKKTENNLSKSAALMRRVLDNLKSDIKSMLAIESVAAGLKLSSTLKGSIKETVQLGDAIRKMGATLGIAGTDFSNFQSKMMRGLGDIGLGSEAASKALEGLAETPVRGQENLIEYSKTAGMLASAFGQQGAEGDIAKGLAGTIQARGGNVNDVGQMKQLAEDLRRVSLATGSKPTDTMASMSKMFEGMSPEFLRKMGTRQMAVMAAGAHAAGPGATSFIQDYLQSDEIQGAYKRVTGQTKLFDEKGFNVEGIKKFADQAKSLGGGNITAGLRFLGIQDEAAKGFVRLSTHLEEVAHAQKQVEEMSGDLTSTYKENRTLGEAFNANLNKLKGFFGKPVGAIQGGLTDMFGKTSESAIGSGAVVAGGGLLAALLAGGGLNSILGKIPGGGLIKGAAGGAIAKEAGATPVYVVNASDFGGMGGGALAAGAASGLGMAQKAGLVGVAALAGYGVGTGVDALQNKYTQGETQEGFQGNIVERLFFKLDKLIGGSASTGFQKNMQIKHEFEIREGKLTPVKSKTRGAAN